MSFNLVIDVGNTRVKAAVFHNEKLKQLYFFIKEDILNEINLIAKAHKISDAIISNVSSIRDKDLRIIQSYFNLIIVSSDIPVPFKNRYLTPKTLGSDRLALAASATTYFPNKNVLIVDAGTCITYDFLSHKNEYLGGAISPGIDMRFKSLHKFTSKLPLISKNESFKLIGDSTEESIKSGVIYGVIKEIEGVIHQYKNQYLDLTVVLTGGDTNFLGKQLKSIIFANQNFLLEGLNRLLIFNKDK